MKTITILLSTWCIYVCAYSAIHTGLVYYSQYSNSTKELDQFELVMGRITAKRQLAIQQMQIDKQVMEMRRQNAND